MIKRNKKNFNMTNLVVLLVIFMSLRYTADAFMFSSLKKYDDHNCSKVNQSECQFCGPGTYFNSTIEECTCCNLEHSCVSCPECTQGYYSNTYNATQCSPCQKGYFNK